MANLNKAAMDRELLDPLEPSDADIALLLGRAFEWDHAPVTGPRILAINEMAAKYYERQLPGSWAHTHLISRFGQYLAGDERFRPGYAPAGWTNLVTHLRRCGVSDDEMLAAGLAKTASTGRLIDRFRDRVILPIISNGQILGFVGRRHPDASDDSTTGPKYLNTADTIVFHKGAQLFGLAAEHLAHGSIPVLVEGPMDAIAVTVATAGAFVGVAPLGTSLTDEQATQLAQLGVDPIVATDGDLAGRIAAERDYWLLTPHGREPRFAQFEAGDDPASLLAESGLTAVAAALQRATSLADSLLDERIANLPTPAEQISEAADVVAAQPAPSWSETVTTTAKRIGVQPDTLRQAVADSARYFNIDRRRFSTDNLAKASQVRSRIEQAATASPTDRRAKLARSLDRRLVGERDWPATAAMFQQIQEAGHDVPALTHQLVTHTPLSDFPA